MDKIAHHRNGMWKYLFLLLTLLLSTKNYALGREIKITFADSESGAKIPNTAIKIHLVGQVNFETNTDSLGCIHFNLPDSILEPICISATHHLYIYKHFCFRSEQLHDDYTILLRQKILSSVDLTTIDSSWIGVKMEKAIANNDWVLAAYLRDQVIDENLVTSALKTVLNTLLKRKQSYPNG